MSNNSGKKVTGWGKVVAWYAKNAYAVNIIYSLGASVVIIGALFKILHWPGASYVLMVGMFTEAFLFMLGIFEPPHATYNWENLFPDLIGHKANPVNLNGAGAGASANPLPEKEMAQLREGIGNLSKAADQIASLGKLATASDKLNQELAAAGQAAQTFTASQSALASSATALQGAYQGIAANIQAAEQDAKAQQAAIAAANNQLAQLNAIYELQLKDAQAAQLAAKKQAEAVQALAQGTQNLAQGTEALKASQDAADQAAKQYAAAQADLAKKVADLNKVYGNMLNAL